MEFPDMEWMLLKCEEGLPSDLPKMTTLYTNAAVPLAVLTEDARKTLLPSRIDDGEPIVAVDIEVDATGLKSVVPAGNKTSQGVRDVDLDGRMVFPGFVDAHVHLDKAFTWQRAPNPRGRFEDALEILRQDREHWTRDDLMRRADFALRCAEAHGTVALRTHIDAGPGSGEAAFDVMAELREKWSGRIELQTVALCGVEQYSEPGADSLVDRALGHPGGLLGGMPRMNLDLYDQLDRLLSIAEERRCGIDLHVDESGDAAAETLRYLAHAVLLRGFSYPVTCGHACSLAVQRTERWTSTIALVRAAGINIISLPLCNLYLQGRRNSEAGTPGTPYWRGVTLIHELMDAGVPVACASDNVRDAFYAYGDFDLFEVFWMSVRIAHLDTRLEAAPQLVTGSAARIMGLSEQEGFIGAGTAARLICFEARSFNELLSRPAQKRHLISGEVMSEPKIPDYRELHCSNISTSV